MWWVVYDCFILTRTVRAVIDRDGYVKPYSLSHQQTLLVDGGGNRFSSQIIDISALTL